MRGWYVVPNSHSKDEAVDRYFIRLVVVQSVA